MKPFINAQRQTSFDSRRKNKKPPSNTSTHKAVKTFGPLMKTLMTVNALRLTLKPIRIHIEIHKVTKTNSENAVNTLMLTLAPSGYNMHILTLWSLAPSWVVRQSVYCVGIEQPIHAWCADWMLQFKVMLTQNVRVWHSTAIRSDPNRLVFNDGLVHR